MIMYAHKRCTFRETKILSHAKSVSVWNKKFCKIVEHHTFELTITQESTHNDTKWTKIYLQHSWHIKNRKLANNIQLSDRPSTGVFNFQCTRLIRIYDILNFHYD